MLEGPGVEPEAVPLEVEVAVAGGVALLEAEAVVASQRERVGAERNGRQFRVGTEAVGVCLEVEVEGVAGLGHHAGVRHTDDGVGSVAHPGVGPLAWREAREHCAIPVVCTLHAGRCDGRDVAVDAGVAGDAAVYLGAEEGGALADLGGAEHSRAVAEDSLVLLRHAGREREAVLEGLPEVEFVEPDLRCAAAGNPSCASVGGGRYGIGVGVVVHEQPDPGALAGRDVGDVPLEGARGAIGQARGGGRERKVAGAAVDGLEEERGRVGREACGQQRLAEDETREALLEQAAVGLGRDRLELGTDLGAGAGPAEAEVGVDERVGADLTGGGGAKVLHFEEHNEAFCIEAPGGKDAGAGGEFHAGGRLLNTDDGGAAGEVRACGRAVVARGVEIGGGAVQPLALAAGLKAEVGVAEHVSGVDNLRLEAGPARRRGQPEFRTVGLPAGLFGSIEVVAQVMNDACPRIDHHARLTVRADEVVPALRGCNGVGGGGCGRGKPEQCARQCNSHPFSHANAPNRC